MKRRRFTGAVVALVALGGAAGFVPAARAQTDDGAGGGGFAAESTAVAQGSARAALIEFQVLGLLPALAGGLPEVEVPFAQAQLQPYGSSAMGSPLWPGAVAGDPGSAISLAAGPIAAQLGPLAPAMTPVLEQLTKALKYPVQARAAYPASPASPPSSRLGIDPAGGILAAGTMQAEADENGASASAAFGETLLGPGVEVPGLPAAFGGGGGDPSVLRASGLRTSAGIRHADGKVRAAATASLAEVDILGGLIRLEGVKSEASTESDGEKAVGDTRTTIGRATIMGQEVSFDENGFQFAGTGAGSIAPLSDALADVGVMDIRLLKGEVVKPEDRAWASSAVADSLQVRMKVPVPILPDLLPSVLGLVPVSALPISLPIPLGLPREVEILLRVGGVEAAADLADGSFELDTGSVATDAGSFDAGSFDPGSFDTGSLDAGGLEAVPPGPPSAVDGGGISGDSLTGLLPVGLSRWGLGGGAVLAVLGSLALLAIFLSYARWQLLEALPGKAGFKR